MGSSRASGSSLMPSHSGSATMAAMSARSSGAGSSTESAMTGWQCDVHMVARVWGPRGRKLQRDGAVIRMGRTARGLSSGPPAETT